MLAPLDVIEYNLFLYFYYVILLAGLRGQPAGTGPSLPPPILDKGREGFLFYGAAEIWRAPSRGAPNPFPQGRKRGDGVVTPILNTLIGL